MLEWFWEVLGPKREKGRALGGPPGGSWATFGVSFLVLRCLVRRSAASRALLEAILSVQHPSSPILERFFSRFSAIFTFSLDFLRILLISGPSGPLKT